MPLIAWIYHAWGLGLLFSLLAAATLAIAVIVLCLPRTEIDTGQSAMSDPLRLPAARCTGIDHSGKNTAVHKISG